MTELDPVGLKAAIIARCTEAGVHLMCTWPDCRCKAAEGPMRAALSAYQVKRREQGFVEVPREPSEAMYDAGGNAEPFGGSWEHWVPGQITAAAVWRAMIAAHEAERGEDRS